MNTDSTKRLRSPLFIVFEGIDGSGKSTQAAMLGQYLKNKSYACSLMAEPTQGVWGKKIREMLKSGRVPSPEEQMRLFILDREEDAKRNILPALGKGDIVIMDRYYFSNAAYQGAGGIDPQKIIRENIMRGFPSPDRVYLIDIDPDRALDRITGRNNSDEKEVFEKRSFLKKVRDIYLSMAEGRFSVINGSMVQDNIHREIVSDLFERFS